ncbi:phage terminase large subunit [Bradyrhizobium oligotrophicum]|uniref:phage terminase large subunit n=1 Tax=Bradyrhizobium oligotrophicum TaxID=44255 RepID=UPI003EB70152
MSRSSTSAAALNLHLHPRQWDAFETVATEVLYGGAAGGGKSHLMRIAAIVWCSAIAGLQVYLFRRIRDDLIKNHMEGPKGFRAMLAGWEAAGFCKIVEDEIRFWNGSKIYLCHCKDEKDIYKYQGAEIHVLMIDELTHFRESMYRFLRNRVRMVGIIVPPEYANRFPRILCGANPGNIGHLWVKTTFVTSGQPMELRLMDAGEGGMLRQYIPARLEDNPSMTEDDPGYERRLEGLGSAQLVKAMRWGDWDVIEGAFFDCWDARRHVVRPFVIPEDWTRFRSGDWGSAKPFSFGWWAVVSDKVRTPEGIILPRGALVRYREWYGMLPGKPNVGLKLHAEKVGEGLAERENGGKVTSGVLDPAAFSEDGGPSIEERIRKGSGYKVSFRPADNKRVTQRGAMGGWDQMRARLVGDGDGNPMVVCFSTCVDSIRTIPALQHDDSRPEDLDSSMEDHAADEWRYACMSRPWAAVKAEPSVDDKKSGYRSLGARSQGADALTI